MCDYACNKRDILNVVYSIDICISRNYDNRMKKWLVIIFVCAVSMIFTGCRSTKGHIAKADGAAESIINEYQEKAIGRTEPFSIERPSDSLRRKLMIDQSLPGYGGNDISNDVFKVSEPFQIKLLDALQISARNSREYQSKKESVFKTALDLDLTRSDYRNSYSGLISALFSASKNDDSSSKSTEEGFTVGATRRLKTGALLTGKLGVDLVKLLTMDKTSTFGIFADATVSIPLLRGVGRDIAREPLTQAERNVIYSIWGFERYKKTFAVKITSEYLRTLELVEQIQNAEANSKRIKDSRLRVEAMARAGRIPETQVNQAKQDELRANSRLISAKQRLENSLDSFKISLGIPVDAKIVLDPEELTRLSRDVDDIFGSVDSDSSEERVRKAILTAFSNRLDLRTTYNQLDDSRRQLNVARDNLDADMNLSLSASTRRTETSGSSSEGTADLKFSDGQYSAMLQLDLPWDKTSERVAFRKSLISFDQAMRAVEEHEDEVKLEVRDSIRALAELEETYHIQKQAVALAERRVDSTRIFMEAGRTQIRDVLEAQEALVSAQNDLVSIIVSYHTASLALQKDLGSLEVNEKGLWQKDEREQSAL